MQLSKTIFRFLLVIISFLALVTLFLFPFQEPGTKGYVITVITLVIQVTFVLLMAVALYLDWDPFGAIEEV
ncbi:hypothetical protein [Halarchaeum sp. P4]|uniref:hypothetical protein n=1 Tax=Halarchaeum sp. P4 TaxID=3421639 RepID=UPI003EC0D935